MLLEVEEVLVCVCGALESVAGVPGWEAPPPHRDLAITEPCHEFNFFPCEHCLYLNSLSPRELGFIRLEVTT